MAMKQHGQSGYSFPKKEKLTSKKVIEGLFRSGSSFYLPPLLLKFQMGEESQSEHRVLFSVSKKKIKSAVKRNLIKRRLREAYRLNKHLLEDHQKRGFNLAIVYIESKLLPFGTIEAKLIVLLGRLKNEILKAR